MYSMFTILLLFHTASSALLLWTPKRILVPALKPFTYNDYTKLLSDVNNPPILAFHADTLEQAEKVRKVLNNNTIYLLKPRIDISEDVEVLDITDETVIPSNITNKNTLVALILPETFLRLKRESVNDSIGNEEVIEESFGLMPDHPIIGAVLYTYVIDKKDEVMIYSSKSLELNIEDTTIYLGNASMTFIDVRESYRRLIVRIATPNYHIVFLRFIFSLSGGYWYLNFVEAEVNSVKYNLALLSNNVTAPNHMSYHCEGKTLFANIDRNITLYLHDLQVQPDAHNHRFSDAYNCIPFITAPILSGLIVTSIMCIGLAIGLKALASIKTMDKFDNSRTKQLNVTLFE